MGAESVKARHPLEPPALALSTMYLQRWPEPGRLERFMRRARDLGFGFVELSHILPEEQVRQLAALAGQPDMPRIRTLHHPCPRPPSWRDAYAITALDAADRRIAYLAIRSTLEMAATLGAHSVVMHLGALEDDEAEHRRRLAFELDSRYRAGLGGTLAYAEASARFRSWREAREPAAIERALPFLDSLAARAAELGLRLGLETGYYLHDLPSPTGMARILAEAELHGWSALGAWLDTGHVGAQVTLGGASWEEWWGAVDGRWLGVHLHDHVGLRDHLLPGLGGLDFANLRRHVPEDADATLEVDWYFSAEELRSSMAHLRQAGWPI